MRDDGAVHCHCTFHDGEDGEHNGAKEGAWHSSSASAVARVAGWGLRCWVAAVAAKEK